MHSKFQNRSTFPSGRKVITSEVEEVEEEEVDLWKQWPLKFTGNTFSETNARANFSMGEEGEKFIFLEDEAAEVTFAHDESDIEEEVDLQYDESW